MSERGSFLVATSRQLHSALDAVTGSVAIGGTVLAGLAADFFGFLSVLDVPALSLARPDGFAPDFNSEVLPSLDRAGQMTTGLAR